MNQTDLKQRSHSQGLSNLMMIITPFPDFFFLLPFAVKVCGEEGNTVSEWEKGVENHDVGPTVA
jgi:hypothetical protein